MKSKNCVLLLLLVHLFCAVAISQEKRAVSGKVVDETGQGIPGVTISVRGTNTTVISNSQGEFTITASPSDVLELSSVGFKKLEVPVGTASALNLSMKNAVGGLTEVVVTALGVSKAQKAVGYATTTIRAEDLVQSGSPNFGTALYGKAPGVRIGATPGGATSAVNITIRGINSITGKSQPFIWFMEYGHTGCFFHFL